MIFALVFSMLFWVLSEAFQFDWFFVLGIISFVGVTLFTVVFL